MTSETMQLHALCSMFPRMAKTEFEALREDIRANGLLTPITMFEGVILDGRNRYLACIEAGVEPRFEEYSGDNLVSFVLSTNLNRRHLMPGQMAVIVASAQDWAKAQKRGGDRKSNQSPASDFDRTTLQTLTDRVALSGAGRTTQQAADKLARADSVLALKVAHGEITLPKALEQLELKLEPKEPVKPHDPYDPQSPTSAFVAAVQAKAAIGKIYANDPNAMKCIESIQKALDTRRALIQAGL